MLRSEKVATQFTAVIVLVPESVPGVSRPPLCPMAIVTEPVKLATVLPNASTAATRTGGCMATSGSVVVGCTVNTKCSGGLSASTVASHALGALKNQVHCGSADPTADEIGRASCR